MENETDKVCINNENCEVLTAATNEDEVSIHNSSGRGSTGTFGAIFIVINAAIGAGLLNIPDGIRLAGGVGSGIALEMVL